jgi:hypothetical protein
VIAVGKILVKFVENIHRRYQRGGLSPDRSAQRGGGGPDLPGHSGSGVQGSGTFREGLKKAPARVKDRAGSVEAPEFQGNGSQAGPGNPERQRQRKGARTKIGYCVSFMEFKGKAGQKPAETVQVPGKKITEIRLKHPWFSQIGGPAFPAA